MSKACISSRLGIVFRRGNDKVTMIPTDLVKTRSQFLQTYNAWKIYSKLAIDRWNSAGSLNPRICEELVAYVCDFVLIQTADKKPFGNHGRSYDLLRVIGIDETNVREVSTVQVKSSVKGPANRTDLTSFGPKDSFDELWYIKLMLKSDKFEIYHINNCHKKLKNVMVSKTETFASQQAQKRRPRFSIEKQLIEKYNLKPQFKGHLSKNEIIIDFKQE